MAIMEITPQTKGWQSLIKSHLSLGDRVTVNIETPSMTPQQMADSIGISRTAIQRRIAEGQIASAKRGNRHLIPLAEVERFRREYIKDMTAVLAEDF